MTVVSVSESHALLWGRREALAFSGYIKWYRGKVKTLDAKLCGHVMWRYGVAK